MDNLEQKIREIEERNRKAELDKAWETSWVRRLLLMGFTYLAVGVYLWVIEIPRPWFNAIVPAVAFVLSTLTMPFFKKLWIRQTHHKWAGKQRTKYEDSDADFFHNCEKNQQDSESGGLINEKEETKRENLEKLRNFIKGRERITNNEVEELLGVSDDTAWRYLNILEKEGLLEQVGEVGQSVYYKVK